MTENELGTIILECAITIHKELGPGLLESVYEVVLAYELNARHLCIKRQVPVPITYKGLELGEGFRADLLVEHKVIVELKSTERVTPAHRKQLQTYLKLADCRLEPLNR